MSVEGTTASTGGSSLENLELKARLESSKQKFTNLSTSTTAIIDDLMSYVSEEKMSPAAMLVLQTLMNTRNQMEVALSQLIRAIGDSAMSVIRNIR